MIEIRRKLKPRLSGLPRNTAGTSVIETAIVAPVLLLMAMGGFEISHMVSRQQELQGGVNEATAVALAANMGAETTTTKLATMLRDSLHLTGEEVVVTMLFRCDASNSYVNAASLCTGENGGWGESSDTDPEDRVSSYVKVELTDTYTPIWSRIGLGGSFTYNVKRMVQLS